MNAVALPSVYLFLCLRRHHCFLIAFPDALWPKVVR